MSFEVRLACCVNRMPITRTKRSTNSCERDDWKKRVDEASCDVGGRPHCCVRDDDSLTAGVGANTEPVGVWSIQTNLPDTDDRARPRGASGQHERALFSSAQPGQETADLAQRAGILRGGGHCDRASFRDMSRICDADLQGRRTCAAYAAAGSRD